MISRQHAITIVKEIHGDTVLGLVCSSYYFEGERISDASLLYIQLESAGWNRFYLDAGLLFWEQVSEPDLEELEGSDGVNEFRMEDIAVEHDLIGLVVVNAEMRERFVDDVSAGQFDISFESGTKLILTHYFNDRRSQFSEYTKLAVVSA